MTTRHGILRLLKESNTLVSAKTGMAEFEADVIARGPETAERFRDELHEIGAFFAELARNKVEPAPLFVARALPYGVIDAAAFEDLFAEMLVSVQSAGPLDGLLVAPQCMTAISGLQVPSVIDGDEVIATFRASGGNGYTVGDGRVLSVQ